MKKPGREFEEAVYAFVKTLDTAAEVIFDHKVIDRDTGESRQCDVWINATYAGHWPLSILVSCKDDTRSRRKLNIGDVEKFAQEIQSTRATMGVIYSNVGFTIPAAKKAKACSIACCRLYRIEPSDIPELVWIDYHVCQPEISVGIQAAMVPKRPVTWHEVFETVAEDASGKTVLEALAEVYATNEIEAIDKWFRGLTEGAEAVPPGWDTIIRVFDVNDENHQKLRIGMSVRWQVFKARREAVLLSGSYSLPNGLFRGTMTSPWIDVRGPDPGGGWIRLSDEEVGRLAVKGRLVFVKYQPDVQTTLRNAMRGGIAIPGSSIRA